MGLRSVTLSTVIVDDDRLQCNTPSTIPRSYKAPLVQSYWAKVERKSADECWPWLAATNNRGYGAFRGNGAHRFAYNFTYGPIPDGLELDHLCSNKWCQNPKHLEAVTHAENMRRHNIPDFASIPVVEFKKHGRKAST